MIIISSLIITIINGNSSFSFRLFLGPEIKFSKIKGIKKTEVGYCGGTNALTSYREVCSGTTNHAEVVKLEFDPEIISYEDILNFFFNDTATTEIYTLSLHDALPICFIFAH